MVRFVGSTTEQRVAAEKIDEAVDALGKKGGGRKALRFFGKASEVLGDLLRRVRVTPYETPPSRLKRK
jgi:hypothetical protein